MSSGIIIIKKIDVVTLLFVRRDIYFIIYFMLCFIIVMVFILNICDTFLVF